jgi:hypothetical protein
MICLIFSIVKKLLIWEILKFNIFLDISTTQYLYIPNFCDIIYSKKQKCKIKLFLRFPYNQQII